MHPNISIRSASATTASMSAISLAIAAGAYCASAPIFATVLTAGVVGHNVYLGMIEERDRLRSIQMADAMAEHEYKMRQFARYENERR